MQIIVSFGAPRKAFAPSNDNASQVRALPPVEQYAVRALAKRAGLSTAHALLVAELAGIARGAQHG